MSRCRRRLLLLEWMSHDRCLSDDLDEDAVQEMDEPLPLPPPAAVGMNEPRSLLSDDLYEDAVQEIVQRTWPHPTSWLAVSSD
jgi:hypothetical protein